MFWKLPTLIFEQETVIETGEKTGRDEIEDEREKERESEERVKRDKESESEAYRKKYISRNLISSFNGSLIVIIGFFHSWFYRVTNSGKNQFDIGRA